MCGRRRSSSIWRKRSTPRAGSRADSGPNCELDRRASADALVPFPGPLQSVNAFVTSVQSFASAPVGTAPAASTSSLDVAPPCHVQDRLSSIGTIPAVTHAILPPFKMNKTLKNVEELWREYTVGLGGHPSTRQMYESRNQSWRRDVTPDRL